MYNESNLILIAKVANGFIVTLPVQQKDYLSEAESFKLQAEIMKETFTGDPLLSNIKSKEDNNRNEIPGSDNVHIFPDFLKVLSFLSDRYNQSC